MCTHSVCKPLLIVQTTTSLVTGQMRALLALALVALLAVGLLAGLAPALAAGPHGGGNGGKGGKGGGGNGARHRGPANAAIVEVVGVVGEIVDNKSFVLVADNKTYLVVLPDYLVDQQGNKIPASEVLAKIAVGDQVEVKGYTHPRPCYDEDLLRAIAITIDGTTYSWAQQTH